jgi:hypothetical protein
MAYTRVPLSFKVPIELQRLAPRGHKPIPE